MPYGTIKVDTITFTDAGVDKSVSISGLVQNPTFTGNVTATGTISGLIVQAPTVTGTTANFASGVYTTQISGAIVKVPAGSAGAPSIQVGVGASVAPGLYGAGTDLLGISTGGAGRIFIDSTGRLGVGTSTPGVKIDVVSENNTSLAAVLRVNSNNVAVNTALAYDGLISNSQLTIGNTTTNPLIFNTNNTERLRIDSSGRVGIGTTSPGNQNTTQVTSDNDGIRVQLQAVPAGGQGPRLIFGHNTNNGTQQIFAAIKSLMVGGNDAVWLSDLAFYTGGSSIAERLRIDSAGNVGIGTSSPGYKLEVFGTSNANEIRSSDGTTISQWYQDTGGISIFGTVSNHPLAFRTNSSERMRIDSSGNVGIGTSSPGALLDVRAGSLHVGSEYVSTLNTDYRIRLKSVGAASNNNYLVELGASGSGPQPSDSDLTINTQTWNGSAYVVTEKMRVTATGRVGIGTSSPSTLLHLAAASGDVQIQFNSGGTSSYIGHDSAFTGLDIAGGGGIKFRYFNGASFAEAARIDSSGRLLVGTSSARGNVRFNVTNYTPDQQLETAGQPFQSIIGGTAGASGPYLILGHQRSGSVGGSTALISVDDLGTISFQGADGTNLIAGAYISAQVDGTPGTNDMPGRLVFSTTADGAAVPTERMRITNAGLHRMFGSGDGLYVACSATAGTSTIAFACRHTAGGTMDGTSSLLVYTNGNVQNTNNSYGAISDIKLKENVVDANSQWDDIKALQVRNYNFKEGQTHTQIGLVAQETELVSPGLVSESPDRDEDGNDLGTVTKSVNYSVLYMKAVKALQEAMERIETLEAKVAALEAS